MPTPCWEPGCKACEIIVENFYDVEDQVLYARTIRKKELEAVAKKERANPTGIPSIVHFPELVDVLPDLAVEYRAIKVQQDKLEARRKELAAEIDALLDAAEVLSIRGDGWTVHKTLPGEKKVLSKELLLELGVTLEQLEAATESVPTAGYVQVKEFKG